MPLRQRENDQCAALLETENRIASGGDGESLFPLSPSVIPGARG
jgi:hypothetical protein